MAKAKQNKKAPLKLIQENKYFTWGMFAAFLICVFLLSSYKIEDDDFFWHLSTGRFIVENKYVPDSDVFSYPSQNAQWIPFEWGWDMMTYELFITGGYTAIFIFRSIIFCFIFLIYFQLLRRFGVNSIVSITILFILLFALFDRLSPRPHIISYLFFTILIYLFLTFKYISREKYLKRLLFLPLIFLIWGNFHPGVLAGGLLLFVFVTSEIIIFYYPLKFSNNEIKPLTKVQLKKLLLISVISAIVLLVNPHGLQTYLYTYSHTKMKMLDSISEWQNPFTGIIEQTFVVTLYKVFLIAGILTLIYAYQKRDLTFALIYISFALYSVRAVRFTVDYEIIIIFFLAVSLDYYLKRFMKPASYFLKLIDGNPARVIIALFFLFVSFKTLSNDLYYSLKFNRQSGMGINENLIPLDLYEFMKVNNVTGNTFNNYETGGYHIWTLAGQKNFIDSRNLNDEIFNEYISILSMNPGFESKLEHYGIDNIIYFEPRLVKYPNELKKYITAYLFKNEKWKLVFWDDRSMFFVRNIPKNAGLIKKYEYKIFNPFTALFYRQEFENNIKNSPQTAKDEIKRKADTEPQGYFYLGMNDIAVKILQGR